LKYYNLKEKSNEKRRKRKNKLELGLKIEPQGNKLTMGGSSSKVEHCDDKPTDCEVIAS
jgi:hypothetical protein